MASWPVRWRCSRTRSTEFVTPFMLGRNDSATMATRTILSVESDSDHPAAPTLRAGEVRANAARRHASVPARDDDGSARAVVHRLTHDRPWCDELPDTFFDCRIPVDARSIGQYDPLGRSGSRRLPPPEKEQHSTRDDPGPADDRAGGNERDACVTAGHTDEIRIFARVLHVDALSCNEIGWVQHTQLGIVGDTVRGHEADCGTQLSRRQHFRRRASLVRGDGAIVLPRRDHQQERQNGNPGSDDQDGDPRSMRDFRGAHADKRYCAPTGSPL